MKRRFIAEGYYRKDSTRTNKEVILIKGSSKVETEYRSTDGLITSFRGIRN